MDKKPNPFTNPIIIQKFKNINLKNSTLQNLRELSTQHYKILNSSFLDKVQLEFCITAKRDLIYYPKNSLNRGRKFQKFITEQNWDPDMIPKFRNLRLEDDIHFLDSSKLSNINGLNVHDILRNFVPYITTVSVQLFLFDFPSKTFHNLYTNIFNIVQEFESLKMLKLYFSRNLEKQGIDFLVNKLAQLSINTSVILEVKDTSSATLLLGPYGQNLRNRLHEITYKDVYLSTLENIADLNNIISSSDFSPAFLKIEIYVMSFVGDEIRNSQEILSNLKLLSPYVTEMVDWGVGFNIFNNEITWPVLKSITLNDTEIASEISKKVFPSLECLTVGHNQLNSLFQNKEKTVEENLKEMFGNYKELKRLVFKTKYFNDDEELKISNPLRKYLMKLMPNTEIVLDKKNL